MLTRLRVQGFKNLFDVEVRFGPFTCVTGKNAVGKSNLFDAIQFLHLLSQMPIMEAAQQLRESKGRSPDPASLFTSIGTFQAPEIRFEADLILERQVRDDFGIDATAAISTVRYGVAFRLNSEDRSDRLELTHESLFPIPQKDARRMLGFPVNTAFKDSVISGARRGAAFISTVDDPQLGPQIKVHHEGHGGRKVPAPKSSRTVLGGMASSDFPTVLAAHREMASWRTLMLEPSAMRAPSEYRDPSFIDSRGANLAAAIERLRRQEHRPGEIYSELTNRLSELIDDVRAVRVWDDEKTETLTLEVQGRDGTFHPARSLSDGTLRFLVLAAVALDPETKGVISLEEPENGMHPERIPAMLRLLRDIAVDSTLAVDVSNPLRQVIVNTHSPVVVHCVPPEDRIYIKEQNVVRGSSRARLALITVSPDTWRAGKPGSAFPTPPGDLKPYLGATGPQRPLAFSG